MMSFSTHEPAIYEFCVQGHLDPEWTDWFNGMVIQLDYSLTGKPITRLVGPVPDQSSLQGILMNLSNTNIQLISVNQVENR
jgi:hypothetical protein